MRSEYQCKNTSIWVTGANQEGDGSVPSSQQTHKQNPPKPPGTEEGELLKIV